MRMAAESYMTVRIGDRVQTPLGKGVVTEVRNERRLLVEVQGRSVRFEMADVSPIENGEWNDAHALTRSSALCAVAYLALAADRRQLSRCDARDCR